MLNVLTYFIYQEILNQNVNRYQLIIKKPILENVLRRELNKFIFKRKKIIKGLSEKRVIEIINEIISRIIIKFNIEKNRVGGLTNSLKKFVELINNFNDQNKKTFNDTKYDIIIKIKDIIDDNDYKDIDYEIEKILYDFGYLNEDKHQILIKEYDEKILKKPIDQREILIRKRPRKEGFRYKEIDYQEGSDTPNYFSDNEYDEKDIGRVRKDRKDGINNLCLRINQFETILKIDFSFTEPFDEKINQIIKCSGVLKDFLPKENVTPFCPMLPCRICKIKNHTLENCKYKNLHDKNYIFGRYDRNRNLRCGYSYDKIRERLEDLKKKEFVKKGREYHCCTCKNFYEYYQIDINNFKCKNCSLPCRICKGEDHNLEKCEYKFFFEKNYIFGRYDRNRKLGCGCSYDEIKKKFDDLISIRPATSKERRYHCCEYHNIFRFYEIDKDFKCRDCYGIFCESLQEDDDRRIQYYQSSEYQRKLVKCYICEIEHIRGIYLDGEGDFCDSIHQAAYKVYYDIQNPNKNIWISIKHYTQSRRTRLASQNINQTAVYRTVMIMQGKESMSYAEALETQVNDKWNDGEGWDNDDTEDINENISDNNVEILTSKEQKETDRFRNMILKFNFSNNIDIENIINNIRKNFESLKGLTMCKSCRFVLKITKVTENNSCDTCEKDSDKDKRIQDLERRIDEMTKEINRYKQPYILIKNFINLFNDPDLILL
ncbi:785_t:CDS:2 [Scutellospora calospora]|uniref:785_t:CDS:1 n=1 Tax=Scutellospora calospora TaxID=85575 RepID=A0ACA9JWR7_9GLOM|nr:785_t:CDS:2 [Scutellospora calospora]